MIFTFHRWRSGDSDAKPHPLIRSRTNWKWGWSGSKVHSVLICVSWLPVHTHCHCYLVAKSWPTLLWPHELQPTRLLCPWDFLGKNTGVGCRFLLQHTPLEFIKPRRSYGMKFRYHMFHGSPCLCVGGEIELSSLQRVLNQGKEGVFQVTECSPNLSGLFFLPVGAVKFKLVPVFSFRIMSV